jgi:predicted amidohydrolase
MANIKIACVQTDPSLGDISYNLDRMRQVLEPDIDLHIFPELALTGYLFTSKDQLSELAEPVGGATCQRLSALAKANETAIITGFLESADGVFFNSALAFDRTGALVGHYRKIHRFYFETQIFECGNLGFPVFDITTTEERCRVGMMICYDWRFPEAARSLTLGGAQLIAVPSNIVTATGMLRETLRTRAFENKVYLAFADRVGVESTFIAGEDVTLEFQGQSAIFSFNGEPLAEAGRDGLTVISATIDPNYTSSKRINEFNDIIDDRIPLNYRSS